jgi:hypothetical protein
MSRKINLAYLRSIVMRVPLFILLSLCCAVCYAQEAQPDAEDRPFTVDGAFVLDLTQKEDSVAAPKKKKVKKKVFYGVKTKKAFTRKGTGERITYETFYILKKAEKPKTFVRDVYYYDFARKEVRKSSPAKFDATKGALLHGPYKRFLIRGVVLEEGIYYKGTRHGRWMKYSKDSVLLDKEKYF